MKKILAILVMILVIAGCDKSKITVCTTSYPIEWIVDTLAGSQVNICNLSQGDFIGRASINKAEIQGEIDVIFHNQQLEPYFSINRPFLSSVARQIIDLSATSRSLPYKRSVSSTGFIDYYEKLSPLLMNQYTVEPVQWMDLKLMTSMSKTILDWLIEHDPINKTLYQERYLRLEKDLVSLDAQYANLNLDRSIKLASLSSAFNIWNHTYRIPVYPIITSRYGVIPNQAQLDIIVDELISQNVHFLIYEDYLDSDLLELQDYLIEEVGLTPIRLSSIFTLSEKERLQNENYISIMQDNLLILEDLK